MNVDVFSELLCAECGQTVEQRPGESYMASTDGKVWHMGCAPSQRAEQADFDKSRLGQLGKHMDSWCVWSKKGRRPCYWHPAQKAAEREAKRLARNFPGQKFIVLHAVSKFGVDAPAEETA